MRSPRPLASLAVAAGFLTLAVALTWPLILHLDTHVPGRAADDNVNFLWNLWWARETLFAAPGSLFFTDHLFHPYGTSLALHTHSAISGVTAATVLRPVSVITAQNLILIAATALNGWCAFLLARRVTGGVTAAIFAGLYFAAAPYFAGHLLGHFNLTHAWGLPLFALTLLRACDRSHASGRAAILPGVVLSLLAYTDYYYVVYATALLVVIVILRWGRIEMRRLPRRPATAVDWLLGALFAIALALAIWIAATGGGIVDVAGTRISMTSGLNLRTAAWVLGLGFLWRRLRPRWRWVWNADANPARDARTLAIVAGVAMVLASPVWTAAAQVWRAGDYIAPPRLWRSATGGIDTVALGAGNPFHAVTGAATRDVYNAFGMSNIEGVAWLGLVPLGLLLGRWRAWRRDPRARVWVAVAAVFLVWALGPYLTVAGANTGLLLPETLLHYVPIVSNARIPGRAMVMVYLAVAMLLAIALSSWRPRAAALVAGLVLVDFISAPVPLFRLDRPAIYDVLAAQPPGAVLELPLGVGDGFGERGALDNAMLYYQTLHGHPLVGGFVARLPRRLAERHDEEPALAALLAASAGQSSPAGVSATRDDVVRFMAAHDVKYVVVNARQTTPAIDELVAGLPLTPIADADGRRVFRVDR